MFSAVCSLIFLPTKVSIVVNCVESLCVYLCAQVSVYTYMRLHMSLRGNFGVSSSHYYYSCCSSTCYYYHYYYYYLSRQQNDSTGCNCLRPFHAADVTNYVIVWLLHPIWRFQHCVTKWDQSGLRRLYSHLQLQGTHAILHLAKALWCTWLKLCGALGQSFVVGWQGKNKTLLGTKLCGAMARRKNTARPLAKALWCHGKEKKQNIARHLAKALWCHGKEKKLNTARQRPCYLGSVASLAQ